MTRSKITYGSEVMPEMPSMEFSLLGPLEVSSEGHPVDLGPYKQRALLALLLINANRLVPTDRILESLWGDDGVGKENALWIYISRLRSALEPEREGRGQSSLIVRRDPGYELVVEPSSIDVDRFESMVQRGKALAHDDPETAMASLEAALDLWRGEPLDEFVYEGFATEEIDRLKEMKVEAQELSVTAALQLGRGGDLVGQLESLTKENPYRERPVGQLMIALYRSGRQSEALRAFDRHRRLVGDELGIDPSPELTRLQEQILLHDPSIEGPKRADTELTSVSRNPYKGLVPFGEDDAGDFHGRDPLIAEVLRRIDKGDGLIALVGPSGSGKSSLVRAGVVPKIRKGAIEGSDLWQIATMVPGQFPFTELEMALLRSTIDPPDSLVHQLSADSDDRILRAALRVMGSDTSHLVLIVDQFEELFTAVEDVEVQKSFLNGLMTAIDDPQHRMTVLLTLRADMYDRPLTTPLFGARLGESVVNVTPMTLEELERAATQPAQEVGLTLEPALLARILSDVSDQPGALPMFQYTLTELYHRRSGSVLEAADYTEMGGVTGAITNRAEDLYADLDPDEQEAARQLFLRLVIPSANETVSRRRVPASDITSLAVDVIALQQVIGRFGDARLAFLR